MPNTMRLALAAALAFGPGGAVAHGQPPQPLHGGQVQEAHENWVELVVHGDAVALYVQNGARNPVPASQVTGSATVLVDGKPHKVPLEPGEANMLRATLPVAVTGRTVATVSLKIDDQPATARFSIEP